MTWTGDAGGNPIIGLAPGITPWIDSKCSLHAVFFFHRNENGWERNLLSNLKSKAITRTTQNVIQLVFYKLGK